MLQKSKLGGIAVAHNGQLINYEQLREMLEEAGIESDGIHVCMV